MSSLVKLLPSGRAFILALPVGRVCTPRFVSAIKLSLRSPFLVANASALSVPFSVVNNDSHARSYCRVGFTCRCVESRLFGTPVTPGGQAQYVRVGRAGGTLYNLQEIPDGSLLADSSLLLLCDILPTGVFAAFQALNHTKILPFTTKQPYPLSSGLSQLGDVSFLPLLEEDGLLTMAVIGLGPVGVVSSPM